MYVHCKHYASGATILLQWPIGALSDRFNRRTVLIIATFLAMGAASMCAVFGEQDRILLFASVGLFCGLSLLLYSYIVSLAISIILSSISSAGRTHGVI